MKFETYKFDIPVWAICPIQYGDLSGLNEQDEKSLISKSKEELLGIMITNDFNKLANSRLDREQWKALRDLRASLAEFCPNLAELGTMEEATGQYRRIQNSN